MEIKKRRKKLGIKKRLVIKERKSFFRKQVLTESEFLEGRKKTLGKGVCITAECWQAVYDCKSRHCYFHAKLEEELLDVRIY